jgi:2Fe-2S ferredoxin
MPKITYIEHDGTEHQVDAPTGTTVMNAALDNLVPGIDADCGGECSCATCHVMVDKAWMAKVGQPSEAEESMLDLNPERVENSRLSCQIPVTDELDGLVVNLPEFQF